MKRVSQSPTEPGFVQSPYEFYEGARQHGPLVYWEEYDLPCALSHELVSAVFRDRRFGREIPPELAKPHPPHLNAFYRIEAHSMLELEPPRHTRLRGLVLRAFTSRRIKALSQGIETLCHEVIDQFPNTQFDLIEAMAAPLPVRVICRLLGVPEEMEPQLLSWSNAMVSMYQARRTLEIELAAAQASQAFADYIRSYIEERRKSPADDLISELISAEADGQRLSSDELITTCILLLNAGHEATVHSFGNGVKALLQNDAPPSSLGPDAIDRTVEEIFRYDPPLHMFTRFAYEEIELAGHKFQRGDEIALMLGAANRDSTVWSNPHQFDPSRAILTNTSFGGGLHFCVGAPLARLELSLALPILFTRCPSLRLTEEPRYANLYHFHGLERLMVTG